MTRPGFSWQNCPYHCTSERSRRKPAGRVWGTGPQLGLRTSNYGHTELGSLFTPPISLSERLTQITIHFLPQNKKANLKTAFHIMAMMLTLVGKMGNLCRHLKDALLARASELSWPATGWLTRLTQEPTYSHLHTTLIREDKMCLAALHLIWSLCPQTTLSAHPLCR